MPVKDNIRRLNSIIKNTSARIVAVSKYQPHDKVLEAYEAGQRLFGENKVQDLLMKRPLLPPDIEWHFIGHLQRNKVKLLLPVVALIHSVDSLALLEEIHKQGNKIGLVTDCLLQIHIAQEETKFGLSFEEADQILESGLLALLTNVRVVGMMGMATQTQDMDVVKNEFERLAQFFKKHQARAYPYATMRELSMGMTNDYAVALAAGSTLLRIGSNIFNT